jgi:flagellar L-ring protein precursor FlgH
MTATLFPSNNQPLHARQCLRFAVVALAAAAVSALTGCATFNAPPKVDLADTRPVQAIPTLQTPPSNGAIFQVSQYRPLFEDHRARLVGDTLTISIAEKVTASQSSNSSLDKSGSLEGALKAVPLVKTSPLDRASISGSSANTFAGKGATENTNDFSGMITVIVTGVLPNGHLQIAGEKQIGVNDNVDVLRFSGQVDPRTIQPGNTVAQACARSPGKGAENAIGRPSAGWANASSAACRAWRSSPSSGRPP